MPPASAVRAAGQRGPRGAGGTREVRPRLVKRHLFLPLSLLLPDQRPEGVSINEINTPLQALCTAHRVDVLSPIPAGGK